MDDFSGQDGVRISVHGEGHAQSPAERATVSLAVGFDGGDRRSVRDRSAATLAVCIESIAVMHDPAAGPVVDWAADDVQVWAERPWNSEGAQLPLVYHSRAQLTATFSDVRRLSVWLEDAASQDGVSVGGITWAVTDLTKRELEARAQRDAVAHAVDKASVYAASLGLSGCTPVELSEPTVAYPFPGREDARMFAMAASAPVDLAPAPVRIDVAIDVRFTARPARAQTDT
ncbi:MAG: SIMPL domain-containing protein [Mycetocola sp.]